MKLRFPFPTAAVSLCLLWGCVGDDRSPTQPDAYFTTSVQGLASTVPTETLDLRDGDTVRLLAAPVRKTLQGREVRMLAYNGSIPGPLLRVPQGARITVRLVNRIGIPTSLYPHGLRMVNAHPGAKEGELLIADRDSSDFTFTFPDPGPFWYHPSDREAYALESGLYGGILVTPQDSGYWAPADREVPLILDDILLDQTGMVRFRTDWVDHAMMGRFGNVFLANGDTALTLTMRRKEVVRFFFTNACNARVLNLGFHVKDELGEFVSRSMRTAGTDMGRYLQAFLPNNQIVAPGERMVSELFLKDTSTVYINHTIARTDSEGTPILPLTHRTLAVIKVLPDSVASGYGDGFESPDSSRSAIASIAAFRGDFDRPPEKNLLLTCRMKAGLEKKAHESADKGIQWEEQPILGRENSQYSPANISWAFIEIGSGAENQAIDWMFARGQRVMIRITNDPTSMNPMPLPIHFQGQRFLVVNINGERDREISWKDTYLVGKGETVDILLDASTPGSWKVQCGIPEIRESRMMFSYRVE